MNSAESGSVCVEALRISATNAMRVRVMPSIAAPPRESLRHQGEHEHSL
jgi:hypothetical protein